MDTGDLAARLVDAKLQDGGGAEPGEVDTLHELLRDFHQALMGNDYAEAASYFRSAQNLVDSEPHEEYEEDEGAEVEQEEPEGYSEGGVALGKGALPRSHVIPLDKPSFQFKNPAGTWLPGRPGQESTGIRNSPHPSRRR